MKLKMAVVALVGMFSFNTFAGLMIEPYIGTGQFATTFDAASLEDDDGTSLTTLGARLGYSLLLVSGGIDYQMDTHSDGGRTNLAAFVGVDLPILLRFYGKYIISSKFENDDLDNDIALNSGYAVGVGFTGLPFVVLNLELETSNYTIEDVAVLGDVDFDYAATTFTVSLPLP